MADRRPLRLVQLAIDVLDVAAARAFWTSLLGYQDDPRSGFTDIYDPRRLNPEIIFQEMDDTEVDRRQQRNRLRFALGLSRDQLSARIDAALAGGGQMLSDGSAERWTIADPEGNEVDLLVLC